MRAVCLSLVFGFFGIASAADGYLDWVPDRTDIAPVCDATLTDLIGTAGIATTAVSAAGLSTTTVSATSFVGIFIAGESTLVIISGTSISIVTSPVVGTGAMVAAVAVSTAYVGARGICALSSMLARTHITNEPIPLVMLVDGSGIFTNTEAALTSGEARFVLTDEIIPVGTPVLSLGILSEAEAQHYPNYQGRGLVRLGQFFDHNYSSKIPEEERGFAVVPANSLNTILRQKFTHQFSEDVVVERNGDLAIVPSGTPFELHLLKGDGWAKIELADGWNIWVDNFSHVIPITWEILKSAVANNESEE